MVVNCLKEVVDDFDKEHLTKQIILIGRDGVVKNIEFDFTEDEE